MRVRTLREADLGREHTRCLGDDEKHAILEAGGLGRWETAENQVVNEKTIS